jgi:hypothetical protein
MRLGDAHDAPFSTVSGVPDEERGTLTSTHGVRLDEDSHRRIFRHVFVAENPGEPIPAYIRDGPPLLGPRQPTLRLFDNVMALHEVNWNVYEGAVRVHWLPNALGNCNMTEAITDFIANRQARVVFMSPLHVVLRPEFSNIRLPIVLMLQIYRLENIMLIPGNAGYSFYAGYTSGVENQEYTHLDVNMETPLDVDIYTILHTFCNNVEPLLLQRFFRRRGGWFV